MRAVASPRAHALSGRRDCSGRVLIAWLPHLQWHVSEQHQVCREPGPRSQETAIHTTRTPTSRSEIWAIAELPLGNYGFLGSQEAQYTLDSRVRCGVRRCKKRAPPPEACEDSKRSSKTSQIPQVPRDAARQPLLGLPCPSHETAHLPACPLAADIPPPVPVIIWPVDRVGIECYAIYYYITGLYAIWAPVKRC